MEMEVFHTQYNLRSQEATYLADAKELGCHLEPHDRDFGAFDADHLRKSTAEQPRTNSIKPGFAWLRNSGSLRVPDGDGWSPLSKESEAPREDGEGVELPPEKGNSNAKEEYLPDRNPHSLEGEGKKRKRNRRHGKESSKKRKRGGAVLRAADGDEFIARQLRLLQRSYEKGDLFQTNSFSLLLDGSRTSTGWHGVNPPAAARSEIIEAYDQGLIKAMVAKFLPVSYCSTASQPAILMDSESRTFLYRTTQIPWLCSKSSEFSSVLDALLGPTLSCPTTAASSQSNIRGPHFPCIMGHYRQYMKAPQLTLWHRENHEAVSSFLEEDIVKRIIGLVTQLVRMAFPGVADRFSISADWHGEKNKIRPLFGLFWNLCVNGILNGQARIHCRPHADSKNVVGVCALLIYVLPGKTFNHSKRSWLVLWEAAVIVELPPWVVVLYPSSLLYHFNLDIDGEDLASPSYFLLHLSPDIKFVTTEGDERPTPENSRPIQEGDDEGRGSLVFFNEASMYQPSETGFSTLQQAKKKGHSGRVDYGDCVRSAFSKHLTTYSAHDIGGLEANTP